MDDYYVGVMHLLEVVREKRLNKLIRYFHSSVPSVVRQTVAKRGPLLELW